jgi:hypothetical protein
MVNPKAKPSARLTEKSLEDFPHLHLPAGQVHFPPLEQVQQVHLPASHEHFPPLVHEQPPADSLGEHWQLPSEQIHFSPELHLQEHVHFPGKQTHLPPDLHLHPPADKEVPHVQESPHPQPIPQVQFGFLHPFFPVTVVFPQVQESPHPQLGPQVQLGFLHPFFALVAIFLFALSLDSSEFLNLEFVNSFFCSQACLTLNLPIFKKAKIEKNTSQKNDFPNLKKNLADKFFSKDRFRHYFSRQDFFV